jgi:UDP-N-acetylmuramate-alanine ligase
MNIYFCGIGGVGLGPLAEIALDAGHTVFGSDAHESLMTDRLTKRGIAINNKQKGITLAKADPAMYSYLNAEDELIIGSKPNGVQVYAYEPQNKLGEFHFGVRSKR